jgi:hypothetical protein
MMLNANYVKNNIILNIWEFISSKFIMFLFQIVGSNFINDLEIYSKNLVNKVLMIKSNVKFAQSNFIKNLSKNINV